MKHKKASIPLEFLVGVVIAVIVFGATFAVVSKMFRISRQASESFDKLTAAIEKVANEETKIGAVEAVPLYMDDGTAIAGFASAQDKVHIISGEHHTWGDCTIVHEILKPVQKECSQTCICLCKDLIKKGEEAFEAPATYHRQYICEKRICRELLDLKLKAECECKIDPKILGIDKTCSDTCSGLFFERGIVPTYPVEKPQPRLRAIYVQKIADKTVALCTNLTKEGKCDISP